MEKGSVKNYIILFLIVVVTIIITFYILSWYHNYDTLENKTPVIDSVSSLQYNDLSNVSKERDMFILYACRTLEEQLNDYLVENNLTDDILYLNLGYDKDENNYVYEIYNKYKSQELVKKLNTYPIMFLFSNGKIIDLLSNKKCPIDIEDIKTFIEGYDF